MFNSIFCKQIIIHIFRNKKILFFEKYKMLKQQKYNPSLDCSLFFERLSCKQLCHMFNNLAPNKIRERCNLIEKIIGKTGKVFIIEQPFMCDYGYNIEFGENFGANHNLLILDSAKVTFGNNVMVGPNCSFITTKHPIESNERKLGNQWAKPITIKDNVWICANATVLAGVTIGENSVIGAGSIVTKDIPPNSFAVGIPCKVVKTISNLTSKQEKIKI